jgi:hypothetical protein
MTDEVLALWFFLSYLITGVSLVEIWRLEHKLSSLCVDSTKKEKSK